MNDDPPNYYFIFSKVNIKRLPTENIIKDKDKKMNFYQSVFAGKTNFRKYSQKNRFGGVIFNVIFNILPFLVRAMTKIIIF